MNNYIRYLVLSYFQTQDGDYDFNDLAKLIGFTQLQLDKLIADLQKNKFIKYINYEIKITDEGLRHLIMQNQINSSIEDEEYMLTNINKNLAMPFDAPYVPKKFTKKL